MLGCKVRKGAACTLRAEYTKAVCQGNWRMADEPYKQGHVMALRWAIMGETPRLTLTWLDHFPSPNQRLIWQGPLLHGSFRCPLCRCYLPWEPSQPVTAKQWQTNTKHCQSHPQFLLQFALPFSFTVKYLFSIKARIFQCDKMCFPCAFQFFTHTWTAKTLMPFSHCFVTDLIPIRLYPSMKQLF